MENELSRKRDLISYLETNDFAFEKKEILLPQKLKRQTFLVSQAKRKMIACIVNGDEAVEKRMLNEIKTLRQINKEKLNFVPALHQYSVENYWYIRESIAGRVAGNVYFFCQEFVDKEYFVGQLVDILLSLQKIRKPADSLFSLEHIADNIKNALSASHDHHELVAAFLKKLLAGKEPICDRQYFSFIHGDTQPTNIILGEDDRLALIDFESCKFGNYLFDFASLYHRAECFPEWQKQFKEEYIRQLTRAGKKFSEEAFNLFLGYFLALDIVSLDVIYLKGRQRPLHNTEIAPNEAQKMISLYAARLKSVVNSDKY